MIRNFLIDIGAMLQLWAILSLMLGVLAVAALMAILIWVLAGKLKRPDPSPREIIKSRIHSSFPKDHVHKIHSGRFARPASDRDPEAKSKPDLSGARGRDRP